MNKKQQFYTIPLDSTAFEKVIATFYILIQNQIVDTTFIYYQVYFNNLYFLAHYKDNPAFFFLWTPHYPIAQFDFFIQFDLQQLYLHTISMNNIKYYLHLSTLLLEATDGEKQFFLPIHNANPFIDISPEIHLQEICLKSQFLQSIENQKHQKTLQNILQNYQSPWTYKYITQEKNYIFFFPNFFHPYLSFAVLASAV
jgi:hypothetical protein